MRKPHNIPRIGDNDPHMKKALLLMILIAAVATVGFAASPQKAGKWQSTMQMEMPGMPVKLPPFTVTTCLTEEDVKDPQKSIPKDPKSDCKIGDYQVDGNKVSWTMECPKQNLKGTGTITYSDDAYTGQMDMAMGEQQMKMKYSGKYLGACDK
jgi:Protein of unknown function (DUF3617)